MLPLAQLSRAIGAALDRGACVPLLVLRLPDLEQVAWREGKRRASEIERGAVRAFCSAARRIVRDGDALGHENGSDRFVVAMLAPARLRRAPGAHEARAALERIGAAMSLSTGRRMQTGWWPVRSPAEAEAIARTIDAALERGAREREHRDLLATVGHELRTPLTSIRGYLETLLEGGVDAGTSRRFLETARREALRLGRIVDGMLEFSMLDLTAPLRAGGCDAVEQIRVALEAIAPLASERAVAVRAQLPASAAVRLDEDACMHALLNLLENAVKYTRPAGCVEIHCTCEGAFVCIAIDDDGPGVAPDDRESIFAMGVRGTASRPGSGIGLAIVKTIAERSGGRVAVATSPLGGARFTLRLPLA